MGLLNRTLLWAEDVVAQNQNQAIRQLGGVVPKKHKYTENDPITLTRLAAVSAYFLIGSRNQATALYMRSPLGPVSPGYRENDTFNLFRWLVSGIAFQHAFDWGLTTGSNLTSKIFSAIGTAIGGVVGGAFGTVAAIINKLVTNDPLLVALKTAITVGAAGGKKIGSGIGSVLGVVPGALGGAVLGIAAELAVTGASLVFISTFLAIETAKFMAFTMLNPFAWARGVSNVYNAIANRLGRVNNFTAEVYNENLAEYNNVETPVVKTTQTVVLETNAPTMTPAFISVNTVTPVPNNGCPIDDFDSNPRIRP